MSVVPAAEAAVPPAAPGSTPSPTYTIFQPPANPLYPVNIFVNNGGEPSIGVNWDTGNAMYQHGHTTLRVVFNDGVSPPTASWQVVSPPYTSVINVDPILFTDAVDGRTYAGGLEGACSVLALTDDDGQNWLPMMNSCALPGWDHQTIGAGPWHEGVLKDTAVYDRAVYYCSQPGLTTGPAFCAVSQDGGLTFRDSVPMYEVGECHGLHGHVRVGPDGTVALPNKGCLNEAAVVVSEDNGLSWTPRRMPGTTVGRFDPSLAWTTNGWLYLGVTGSDGKAVIGLSKDNGRSWTNVKDVSSSLGIVATEWAEVIAGDDQRAAFAFLGTKTGQNTPGCSNARTEIWHMYVAMTYDGGSTWTTQQVTQDPVQRGPLGDADDSPCRNLLDFNDITVDKQGRVMVAFADGCINACAAPSGTVAQSTSSYATIARLTSGRGLFAEYDEDGPLNLAAIPGGPYGGSAGSAIGLDGAASGGTTPYTFSWSVVAKPTGSAVGPTSFGNPGAGATTFTPDIPGVYTLRLDVSDSAGGSATGTTSVSATPSTGNGASCGVGAVVVGDDADTDGGDVGGASEVKCLRMSDDAVEVHFYVDLTGTEITETTITADNPLYYDLHFKASYANDVEFVISTQYDGAALTTGYVTPGDAAVTIPNKVAHAELDGNTLHVWTARSEILSPTDGQKLTSVYVDVNWCSNGTPSSCDLQHVDVAPDAQNGVYTLGGSGGSGTGLDLPVCSVELATDSATDSTATSGKGRRDGTRLGASDTDATWTFCWNVANLNDAPSGGVTPEADRTRYSIAWMAPYEGPQIGYSARVVLNADGTVASAQLLKGYAGVSGAALAQGAITSGEVVDGTVRLTVRKADIGNPEAGEVASSILSNIGDDGSGNGNQYVRIPNTGTASFTFGQKMSDITPPSQVQDLLVTDPATGTTLNLAWTAALDDTGVTRYVVNRSTTPGGPYATVGTPAGTSFTDTGLTSGATYYYKVAARDAAGNWGPESLESSGTPTDPVPDTTPPSVPVITGATGTETSKIKVTWSAANDPESGVREYRLYRDGALVGSTAFTTYDDVNLQPDTEYTYQVLAVNNQDLASSLSAPFAGRTLPLPAPDCGQVAFELTSDPDFDSPRQDRRTDLVRVSVHETTDRIWFHLGARNLSELGEAASYRIVLFNGNQEYTVIASYDDNGPGVYGVYAQVSTPVASGGPRTSQDLVVQRACDSLVMGLKRSDIGSPAAGATLTGIYFETASNTTQTPVLYDRAPNADVVQYVIGSSQLAPVLADIGDKMADEGATLAFTVSATDPNGDTLAYSATGLPAGATFDSSTRTFTWTPTYAQAGTYGNVRFTVSDGDKSDEETITISVANVNTVPTLEPIGNRNLNEGDALTITLVGSDADGDALTYAASGLPAGATFDAQTGQLQYAAPFQAGHEDAAHEGIVLSVSDGVHTTSETISIAVADVNRAPTLGAIGNQQVQETQTLSFAVSATDADGDVVTIGATGLPAGAAFDGTTFTWTPAFGQDGNHVVTFSATDGTLQDSQDVVISVGNVNRPPVLDAIGPKGVNEGATLTFTVSGSDPDGDALTYRALNLPTGATFDASTRTFTWTPGFQQAGAYNTLRFEVTDGATAVGETVSITVLDVDRAPTLNAIADATLKETQALNLAIRAADPDGTPVTLTADGVPTALGATFTDNGDGTATLRWTPPAGSHGAYPITVTVSSNGLTAQGSFTVTVLFNGALSLTPVGSPNVAIHPGQLLTLSATLTNLAGEADTFSLSVSDTRGWTTLGTPASVTLQPGESATVTLDVKVPATGVKGAPTLRAQSTQDSAAAKTLAWTLDVRVVLSIHVDNPDAKLGERITGTISAKFLNGANAKAVYLTLEQTPETLATARTVQSGVTDSNGLWFFDLSDARAKLPGKHLLTATGLLAGGASSTATGEYVVTLA